MALIRYFCQVFMIIPRSLNRLPKILNWTLMKIDLLYTMGHYLWQEDALSPEANLVVP
jgi:hypothetical protein